MPSFQGLLALPVLLLAAAAPASADPVEDFYRGKTVTLAVGTSPGGDYDLRLRMVGRHIGRHIPGQSDDRRHQHARRRRARGGELARQRGAARRHGGRGGVAEPAGDAGDRRRCPASSFDVRKFHWIGNTTDTPNVINSWVTTGIRTIQDVMQRELVVGATGNASGSYLYPHALNLWSAPSSRSSPATRAATTSTSQWSAARSAAAVRIRGRRGSRRARNGWRRRRSSSWCRSALKRNPNCPTCRPCRSLRKNDIDRQVLDFHFRRHRDLAPARHQRWRAARAASRRCAAPSTRP